MQRQWKIKQRVPQDFIAQFPEYSPIVLKLLWDRGLKTQKEIDEFFNPDYGEDIHDPFLLKDCKKALGRILKAVAKKEKILIYGDYDCDGVCAALILFETLKLIHPEDHLSVYLPNRETEGYGLNKKAITQFGKDKIDLIITVDCGISNWQEIDFANKLGIDVVVIDHHSIPPKLPKAYAIINPHQKGDKYPFKHLAGAGVAFKIATAILNEVKSFNLADGQEKWLLDLVALATVTDCMPILGENRTLVKYGLVVLAQTRRKGLKELMKIARVGKSEVREKKYEVNGEKRVRPEAVGLSAYTLGYILGPRLNAAGRMDHANTAYKLLIADMEKEVQELALKLENQNKQRQKKVDDIVKEIESRLNSYEVFPKIIFEGRNDWLLGVVGAAAGKITDRYWRPTLIFTRQNLLLKNLGGQAQESNQNDLSPEILSDRVWAGSGRSIPGFNMVEAIRSCSDLCEKFGGHPGAAGFTVKDENLDDLRRCLEAFAQKKLKDEDLIPIMNIDQEVSPADIDWNLYDDLEKFEPFGQENSRPIFLVRNLQVADFRIVGNNGRHIKLTLYSQESEKRFKAIIFGVDEKWKNEIKAGARLDVVFELDVDEWNGNRELLLKIIDLRNNRHKL